MKKTGGLIEDQRSRRDWQGAESARRCSSHCEAGAGPVVLGASSSEGVALHANSSPGVSADSGSKRQLSGVWGRERACLA
jgi:hypothetical protein